MKRWRRLVGAAAACLVVIVLPAAALAQMITRGPYLQMPGPDRMLVVFHTDVALTDANVEYGISTALGSIAVGTSSADAMGGFKHVVQLESLGSSTKYFYAVGSAAGRLTTAGADYAFTTSPPHGTRRPIRIWTFGDSGYWPGKGGTRYMDTRQAYYDLVGGGDVDGAADATDVMLYLGDNAYVAGDDVGYQNRFFSPPPLSAFLRRQPFFSAIGNHEGIFGGADSVSQTGDYFDIMYFPTANELGAGGVASGTEAYYSFDYGNIHFVVLDSEDSIENLETSAAVMVTWLENDLAATSADWIIAAWHKPPYSKGAGHDSDVEQAEIDMRELIVPVLDDYGVDLVLTGHAHSYERTPLLDGHYGFSTDLLVEHFEDGGDGDPDGDGAYRKPSLGQGPGEGAVYVVAGSPADLRTFEPEEGHPAMARSLLSFGTAIIEVDGDVLTGRFLDDAGDVLDTFRIDKGVGGCPSAPLAGCSTTGNAKLSLKAGNGAGKDRATFKLSKAVIGDASVDPVTRAADLAVCAWDGSGAMLGLVVPNSGVLRYATLDLPSASWVSKRRGRYRYDDKEASVNGLKQVKVQSGLGGSVKASARGAGAALPQLPVAEPVVAQFINLDTGQCWDVSLAVKKNDSRRLVAAGP